MIEISFDSYFEFIKYKSSDFAKLCRGDVIINGVHNPYAPSDKSGLYYVVNPIININNIESDVFVINLRSNTPYTYKYMKERFQKHGFFMVDITGINATVRRAE